MKAFLDSLDPRVRAGVAIAVGLLAAISLWGVVHSSITGPWLLPVGLGVLTVAAFQMEGVVWPPKFPWKVQDAIDKWSKRRSTIVKTTMGRISWKVMRSVAGLVAAWYFCEPLARPVRFAVSVGFGASFGFFGASASMWGALVSIGIAATVASRGLGVNFAAPGQRSGFLEEWSSGRLKLSWLWAIGFAMTPALWFGIAASVSSTTRSILDKMEKSSKDSADRKRIEERRKRLESRRMTGSEDIVGAAEKRLDEMKERVRAAIRKAGPAGSEQGGGEYSPSGEDVLRKANMEDALSQYAAQVSAILKSERSGVDMESQGRRAFDRVILAMSDDMVTRIRTADSPGMKDLYGYYERVCEAEMRASGGDGALVSTRVERREDDYIEQTLGDGSEEPPQEEGYGSIGLARAVDRVADEDGEDDDDVLDSPRPSRGRLMMPDDLLPVTTGDEDLSVGADGTPVGGGLLPVDEEEEVQQVPGGAGHMNGVANGLGEDHYEAEELVPDEAFQGLPKTVAVAGAHEGPSEHEDLEHPDDHSHEDLEPALVEEPLELDEPLHDHEPSEPVEPVEAVDEGAAAQAEPFGDDGAEPSAEEHAAPIHEETIPMTSADEGGAQETPFSQEEKRNAAAMILSNQVDRGFVERFDSVFRTVSDAAAALSVPEIVFTSGWPDYAAKADALAAERVIRQALDEKADDDILRTSLDELVKGAPAGWTVDPSLSQDINAELTRREDDRRIERERKDKEEQDRKDQEERDRVAEAQRKEKEEQDRKDQEERDRAEEERKRLDREREEHEEAERLRLIELEAKRMNVAIKLLARQHDEETVSAATELFQDQTSLAAALGLDEMVVESPFQAFVVVRDARLRYVELISAIASEDVNGVEALVMTPEAFSGYTHPEMTVETARKWAEGVRARERVKGIVETARPDIASTGVATRKLFLGKRLKLSAEVMGLIDKDLVEAFNVVKTTREFVQMATRNGMLPSGMGVMLSDAESRLAGIARRIVAEDKAAEYVRAFLPDPQRLPDKDPWEMLVEIASGDTGVLDQVEAPPEEEVDEAPAPYVPPAEPVELVSEAVEETGRISKHISFEAFKAGPTLEEVQAMDWRNIVAAAKAAEAFDPAKISKRIMLSMSEFMSTPEDRISMDGNFIHIPVDGPNGQIGKILVEFIPTRLPVWYLADNQQIIMKNGLDGKIMPVDVGKFLSSIDGAVEKPNGHPDTPIGIIMLSSLISPEGLISFQPLMEDQVVKRGLKDALLIADIYDNEGIKAFYAQVRDAAAK